MKQIIFKGAVLVYLLLTMLTYNVQATQPMKYVVMPFKVHAPSDYMYLERAIPSMLTSRLYKDKYFQPVPEADIVKTGEIFDVSTLEKVSKKIGVNVIVWGEVSIVGDDAVLDVRVYRDNGETWRQHKDTKVNDLLVALQEVTDAINQDIFKHKEKAVSKVVAMPSVIKTHEKISNVNQGDQVYCNPQFHYQGSEEFFTRSQSLPFSSIGLVVADINGDKKNEVVILSDHKVHMYHWEYDRLVLIAEYKLPRTVEPILIRNFDINNDGVQEIIISGYESKYGKPCSFVLSFKDNIVKEIASNVPFYMNVVSLPPDFLPVIIGQKDDSAQIFSRSGVYYVDFEGNNFKLGSKVFLPSEVNVFSFSWIPSDSQKNEDRLVSFNTREELVVYDSIGSKLYVTGDKYYGSAIGINEPLNMPGLGKSKDLIPTKYYIPIRMIPISLEDKKRWGILVSRSISVAAQFFENYRAFSEGEIQMVCWNGMGLESVLKTPLIKGSITDFVVADINNDGQLDLVASINNYIGVLGIGKRRTTLIFYPLKEFSNMKIN